MLTCSQLSFISSSFSILSLSSWIWAQLPQIYINYKNKSADGISPSFLLLWFMGDFLSFTSCLLNDVVLNFQVYLSLFFLCNDVTLCYQYYYYNSVYPRKYGNIEYSGSDDREESDKMVVDENSISKSESPAWTNNTSVHSTTNAIHIRSANSNLGHKAPAHTSIQSISSSSLSTNNSYGSINDNPQYLKALAVGAALNSTIVLALPIPLNVMNEESHSLFNRESIGVVLAWCCTFVYVASRCPQLYKNYKRKSVNGISPILFGCALVGNLTYTLSILTSCDFIYGDEKSNFFIKELPYILGSSGTVLFDFVYFYQRYVYRDSGKNTDIMGMDDWDNIPNESNGQDTSPLI